MKITSIFGAASQTPKLKLNFLAAVLDSKIAVTRALNTATRINSSGLVETVNADLPRFDYDPATLQCKGLLVEETRSNLMLSSQDWRSAANGNPVAIWVLDNSSVSADAATSPNGTVNAGKLIESATTAEHYAQQATTVVTATAYAYSFFVKPAGRNVIRVREVGGTNATVWFDLTGNGSVIATQLGAVGSIKLRGDGWYKCTMTFTSSGTLAAFRLTLSTGYSTTSYAGDGTSGVCVWGAQLEAGAFATSYIPTTTGTVQRNADVAVITGANFSGWWVAGRGTVIARYQPSTVSGTRPVLQFDDTTADNIIALRGNTTNPELYIKATTDQAQIDAGAIAANTSYRLAGTWDTNNCAATLNSGVAVTDLAATIPAVTQARLGSDGTNYLNGHLEAIEYWDQRLSNATLQSYSTSAGYQSLISPVIQDNIIS